MQIFYFLLELTSATIPAMKKKQQPTWQPIEKLSLIAYIIDGTLASAHETYQALQQGRQKPYSLDDATVNRAIKLFTDQKNGLWEFDEQLRRWTTQQLRPEQRMEIERLERQMKQLHSVNTTILVLTDELKEKTIEKLLAKSDAEVGIEYLLGLLPVDEKQ